MRISDWSSDVCSSDLLDQGVADHAGTGHAVGMADGDGAAVDVQPVVRDAELVAAVEHLDGEGLVQLPQADVVDPQAVALEQLRYREDRADAHVFRLAAGDGPSAIGAETLQPAATCFLRHTQD